jgi:hypothetical protein
MHQPSICNRLFERNYYRQKRSCELGDAADVAATIEDARTINSM